MEEAAIATGDCHTVATAADGHAAAANPTPIPPRPPWSVGAFSAFICLGNTGYDVLTYGYLYRPGGGSVTGTAPLDVLGTEADLAEHVCLSWMGFLRLANWTVTVSRPCPRRTGTVGGAATARSRQERPLQPGPSATPGQPAQEKIPYIRFADYLGTPRPSWPTTPSLPSPNRWCRYWFSWPTITPPTKPSSTST